MSPKFTQLATNGLELSTLRCSVASESAWMSASRQRSVTDLGALSDLIVAISASDRLDVAAPQDALLAVAALDGDVEPGARDLWNGRGEAF